MLKLNLKITIEEYYIALRIKLIDLLRQKFEDRDNEDKIQKKSTLGNLEDL